MNLIRSVDAIDVCRKHIQSMSKRDPQIEAVLSSYACAVIYAELEGQVRQLVANRVCHGRRDVRVQKWGYFSAKRLIRSIKIGELAGVAGHFDAYCKSHFNEALDDQCKAAWDQIVQNRHGVAHETDDPGPVSTLTFAETEVAFKQVEKVLDAFAACLHHVPTGSDQ